MLATVVLPNVIAMVLLLVLLFSSSRVSRRAVLTDTKIFSLMTGCNFFQCANEIFAYSVDGVMLPGFYGIILISNVLLFVVNIFFAFLWVVYANYKIFESMDRVKKQVRLLALPAAAVIIASLVNLFVPVFFEITPSNHYQRSMLFFVPYMVTYFYLIYGTVFIYRHKSQARKYVFLPATVFMAPIVAGSVVQLLFYGVSTVWVGVAIALMAVYVNVQNEMSYLDALSGLYTRVYMHQYLEDATHTLPSSKKIAGIMVDVDKFKAINDQFGHLAGDDAIRSVGKILLNTLPDGCIAARYGGDEFVVLQEVSSDGDVRVTMESIERAVEEFNRVKGKPYTLRFSMGWSVLDLADDTVDAFLGRMDQAMYEVKHSRRVEQ